MVRSLLVLLWDEVLILITKRQRSGLMNSLHRTAGKADKGSPVGLPNGVLLGVDGTAGLGPAPLPLPLAERLGPA